MPTDQVAFYIDLKVRAEHQHVYVTSEQIPGLHLLGRSFQSMRSMIETAIKRLYQDNQGVAVNVIWLQDAAKFPEAENVLEKLAVYKKAA